MILRMNHQALYAPIPIFQRSSNVPRGTFSKDQHLFQYSDVSRGTFLRKNALRHHPFDFSILVRSKNSLHILDSNSQELFFFARLVVRNLMPGSQAPNTMRRLKDQLLFQCSNVPRGTFSKEDRTFSLLASSPEPSLCVSHLLNQQATRCADSKINSYSNARMFHVEHFQKKTTLFLCSTSLPNPYSSFLSFSSPNHAISKIITLSIQIFRSSSDLRMFHVEHF